MKRRKVVCRLPEHIFRKIMQLRSYYCSITTVHEIDWVTTLLYRPHQLDVTPYQALSRAIVLRREREKWRASKLFWLKLKR